MFLNFVVFLEGAAAEADASGAAEPEPKVNNSSSLYLQLSNAEGVPVASAGPISVQEDLAQSDNFEPCEVLFYSTDPKSGEQEEEPPVARGTLSSARQTRVVAEEEDDENGEIMNNKCLRGPLRFVDESDAQVPFPVAL